jgi:undecaprenyl-diphosphatase
VPVAHAIVLGALQGLTEFLPISSSGHLIVVPWLLGWNDFAGNPDLKKAFDVALHLGTFVGAAFYFRSDLLALARAGLGSIRRRAVQTEPERMAWLLLLSTVPAAVTGATLESVIEDELGQEWLIGVMLVVFGVVLWWADRARGERPAGEYGRRDAIVMGAAQALALQPGVSRSGVTISAGRWLGFDRDAATRLSFLMSLPIIGGAGLYEGVDVLTGSGIPSGFWGAFAWGMAASAVTGFLAVWGLLRLLRTTSFTPFVAYRVVAGCAVVAVAASGLR